MGHPNEDSFSALAAVVRRHPLNSQSPLPEVIALYSRIEGFIAVKHAGQHVRENVERDDQTCCAKTNLRIERFSNHTELLNSVRQCTRTALVAANSFIWNDSSDDVESLTSKPVPFVATGANGIRTYGYTQRSPCCPSLAVLVVTRRPLTAAAIVVVGRALTDTCPWIVRHEQGVDHQQVCTDLTRSSPSMQAAELTPCDEEKEGPYSTDSMSSGRTQSSSGGNPWRHASDPGHGNAPSAGWVRFDHNCESHAVTMLQHLVCALEPCRASETCQAVRELTGLGDTISNCSAPSRTRSASSLSARNSSRQERSVRQALNSFDRGQTKERDGYDGVQTDSTVHVGLNSALSFSSLSSATRSESTSPSMSSSINSTTHSNKGSFSSSPTMQPLQIPCNHTNSFGPCLMCADSASEPNAASEALRLMDTLAVLQAMPSKTVVCVLTALLEERRVAIVGPSSAAVSRTVLALAAMLSPLEWPHILVACLTQDTTPVLSAPCPFLVGVLSHHLADALNSFPLEETLLVHIDNSGGARIENVGLAGDPVKRMPRRWRSRVVRQLARAASMCPDVVPLFDAVSASSLTTRVVGAAQPNPKETSHKTLDLSACDLDSNDGSSRPAKHVTILSDDDAPELLQELVTRELVEPLGEEIVCIPNATPAKNHAEAHAQPGNDNMLAGSLSMNENGSPVVDIAGVNDAAVAVSTAISGLYREIIKWHQRYMRTAATDDDGVVATSSVSAWMGESDQLRFASAFVGSLMYMQWRDQVEGDPLDLLAELQEANSLRPAAETKTGLRSTHSIARDLWRMAGRDGAPSAGAADASTDPANEKSGQGIRSTLLASLYSGRAEVKTTDDAPDVAQRGLFVRRSRSTASILSVSSGSMSRTGEAPSSSNPMQSGSGQGKARLPQWRRQKDDDGTVPPCEPVQCAAPVLDVSEENNFVSCGEAFAPLETKGAVLFDAEMAEEVLDVPVVAMDDCESLDGTLRHAARSYEGFARTVAELQDDAPARPMSYARRRRFHRRERSLDAVAISAMAQLHSEHASKRGDGFDKFAFDGHEWGSWAAGGDTVPVRPTSHNAMAGGRDTWASRNRRSTRGFKGIWARGLK